MMMLGSNRVFDPNIYLQLLLDLAHVQSVDMAFRRILDDAEARTNFTSVQIWLVREGDRCESCPLQVRCPDRTHCLHLVAGMGRSLAEDKTASPRFDDPQERNPLGVGLLGEAASNRQQIIIQELSPDQKEHVLPYWTFQERIRSAGATPILFKGELLGVIAGYARDASIVGTPPWARVIADHLGAAIANARAFEEILRLKSQLEQQNTYLQEEVVEARAFGDLIGQSSALHQIISQIDLVAPTEASVLILGETGTGKELVAYEIHRRSKRRDRSLVRVNCASVPKELFESEFFGHVKGAFTGAVKDRSGRFEAAEGGTIFLDEIGEVPLEMQAKLLRVLQEKRYERVGDDRTRHADVRIIAATNRDLKKEVVAGRFREDLYYRLNVFPIQVVPLRERVDDIPFLAQHFVRLSCKELKCPQPRLTRAEVAKLQSYPWPGNVRELRNIVERAVILARGRVLEFDLAPTISVAVAPAPGIRVKSGESVATEPGFLTEMEMQQFERANLLAVLKKSNWKIKGPDGAAELLGVKPTTLVSRMSKWGINRPKS